MDILLLGGTQFVGRHIVEDLAAGGHRVSMLTRGRTRDELPPEVERLRGDRDTGLAGLEALRGRSWDACVDVSGYTPRQVRASAELLSSNVGRYVFISAVAVYGDPRETPVCETHTRVPAAGDDVTELNNETYGRAKVACEDVVEHIFADRSTLLRPQIVAGPHDPFDRYSYWVRRAGQRGRMLAPGDGSDHVQVIDARDAARFVRGVIERDLRGAFNLAGPRITWRDFMRVLDAQKVVWVPAAVLGAACISEVELPLFRPDGGPRSGLMNVSNVRARTAGLGLTEPRETARATRAWITRSDLAPALSREREAELIRAARGAGFQPDRPANRGFS